ncbi:CRISPR-associated helicase Cas3' [Alkalibacter saccharofermentans]|uniref:CRISPR-associated endonuclease/helicase Cas3 n=1 Tax=Alkalibacter saccharofermentans DSM 14828 TaxID=1120975 RepID=A0A1M4VAL1_9FIRM|nr:CRISPR-associated helicase Cas3' [Alkalibacter saccharofermentans]SHE65848.1 CRISPR-associated endonuclease/helicase Cas3 [Alkalibacter saccharofermentans DSM 14828]
MISEMARSLWAKKSKDQELMWLPLVYHMKDAAMMAKKIWNLWIPEGVIEVINDGIADKSEAEKLFVFLSAVHDLGKATPVFQAKSNLLHSELESFIFNQIYDSGLPIKPSAYFKRAIKTPHALATYKLLEQFGCNTSISSVAGSHHGKPPENEILINSGVGIYAENFHLGKEGYRQWTNVQQELIEYSLELAGFSSIKELPSPQMSAQVLLSGLIIMVDWIVSNEKYFPLIRIDELDDYNARSRIEYAWDTLLLTDPWRVGSKWIQTDFFQQRFDFMPNELQATVLNESKKIESPGIMIIEAPMGVGKTEAALVAAEIFASKSKRKGVFFALPTQSTSDGIFPRILKWVEKLDCDDFQSLRLMHGKAEFNELYQKIRENENDSSSVFVHEWYEGRKKNMLDDFAVGTIDQLLLAALKQKHVMLRHLGLANKVVIIDECHAYDAYMCQYLSRALNWLGAYRVPVIVLSATLTTDKRREVIDAYLNKASYKKNQSDPLNRGNIKDSSLPEWSTSFNYPIITYTEGNNVSQIDVGIDQKSKTVQVDYLSDNDLFKKLNDLISDGGCAGIIVNTVSRAQKIAKLLSEKFDDNIVKLYHSRFLAPDRAEKERLIISELGKPSKEKVRPYKRIIVGTQVLEQSLDIDFDVLITDISPMDLILQRIGRLHRHSRERPEKLKVARCFLTGIIDGKFEEGTEKVYGEYLLLRTRDCIPSKILLPDDISQLVQKTYAKEGSFLEKSNYTKAFSDYKKRIQDKIQRANSYRIDRPWVDGDMKSWLQTYVGEKSGEAAVRDGDESIEVLVVQKDSSGRIRYLPWIENGRELPKYEVLDKYSAQVLARCRIRLPSVLCAPWNIDKTIEELELLAQNEFLEWLYSPWLSGELFLVLDSRLVAKIGEYFLFYSQTYGLYYEKEERLNEGKRI